MDIRSATLGEIATRLQRPLTDVLDAATRAKVRSTGSFQGVPTYGETQVRQILDVLGIAEGDFLRLLVVREAERQRLFGPALPPDFFGLDPMF